MLVAKIFYEAKRYWLILIPMHRYVKFVVTISDLVNLGNAVVLQSECSLSAVDAQFFRGRFAVLLIAIGALARV